MGAAETSYQTGGSTPPWGDGEILEDVEPGAVLGKFAPYLTLADTRELSFALYESTNFNGSTGTFVRVWKHSLTYSAGEGFCESPEIGVELDADSTYFVGVGGLSWEDDRWFSDDDYPAYAGLGWATGYYLNQSESWAMSFQAVSADENTSGVGYVRFEYYP
jgi:hypothetical protein